MPPLRMMGNPARGLQPIYPVIVERRDVTIFLRRQSIEPGFAGVDDQRIRAGGDDAVRQRIQRCFRILIVDADPALTVTRDVHGALQWHGHKRRPAPAPPSNRRQKRPPLPDPTAADIEVDFFVAKILADFRCCGEMRDRSPKLKRCRVLACIEPSSRVRSPGMMRLVVSNLR